MSALLAETLDPTLYEAELEAERRGRPTQGAEIHELPQPANTTLHHGVFKILGAINVAILAAFWFTLRGDPEALFMVAISGVYLAAYLGTPFVMNRVAPIEPAQQKPFAEFLAEPFETWTGRVSGREATIQILLVPTAVLLAVLGMCVIFHVAG